MSIKTGTLSANLHLTHNCNLRCTYCYTGEKFGSGMSDETADAAADFCLDEAGRAGADHLELVFFGGEPLLKVDLLCRILDRLDKRRGAIRISSKVSTNGVLLSERVVRRLAVRGVYVSISLDGDPEIQAAQRPDAAGRDIARRLDEAVSRLLAWNPCASVHCVVTPASAGRLDESVRWFFDRGFSYVQTALDFSAAWERRDLARLRQSYQRLAEWYIEQTISGRKFYLSCFDQRIQTWTRGPLHKSERCLAGERQFSISPSGRLYPCVQFVRDDRDDRFVIGDVRSGFNAGQRHSLACQADREKPECRGCLLLERCSSWCACLNWQTTGRLDQASPLVCEHERLLMPIADAVANRLWKRRDTNFLHKQYNPAFPALAFAENLIGREEGAEPHHAETE